MARVVHAALRGGARVRGEDEDVGAGQGSGVVARIRRADAVLAQRARAVLVEHLDPPDAVGAVRAGGLRGEELPDGAAGPAAARLLPHGGDHAEGVVDLGLGGLGSDRADLLRVAQQAHDVLSGGGDEPLGAERAHPARPTGHGAGGADAVRRREGVGGRQAALGGDGQLRVRQVDVRGVPGGPQGASQGVHVHADGGHERGDGSRWLLQEVESPAGLGERLPAAGQHPLGGGGQRDRGCPAPVERGQRGTRDAALPGHVRPDGAQLTARAHGSAATGGLEGQAVPGGDASGRAAGGQDAEEQVLRVDSWGRDPQGFTPRAAQEDGRAAPVGGVLGHGAPFTG